MQDGLPRAERTARPIRENLRDESVATGISRSGPRVSNSFGPFMLTVHSLLPPSRTVRAYAMASLKMSFVGRFAGHPVVGVVESFKDQPDEVPVRDAVDHVAALPCRDHQGAES